jgi:hypothetical protein
MTAISSLWRARWAIQAQVRLLAFTFVPIVWSAFAHAQSAADCPFNVDQSSAANSRRATTDGLIFIRYALNLPSTTPPVGGATENPSLTSAQVTAHMSTNAAALDIDGDGRFTAFDAQIIARYLLGFRGGALLGTLEQPDFAKRYGVSALASYIDGGCNPANDPIDPRIAVWNAMNAQLALGTVAGIDGAKQYMTDTAVANYTDMLTAMVSTLPAVVASYSVIIPRQVGSDYAEYWVSRPLVGGTVGERLVHPITFVKTSDGSWRIDGM